MTEAILILNAGSSSIKFTLFPAAARPTAAAVLCKGYCEGIGHHVHFSARDKSGALLVDRYLAEGASHEDSLAALLTWLESHFHRHRLITAGHRVVHGGTVYFNPVRLNAAIVADLHRLVPLAPLHQPHHLAAIEALSHLHPALPQIACFDTAFHHTQPAVAAAFALPRMLSKDGIRRYGFHGLSYEYIAGVLPDIIGAADARGRVIVAHLGAGASMCALYDGKSIATTMGFTALDGLPMGKRCGSLDPGVILYLMQAKGMSAAEVSDLLYHSSGLLGVSGLSDDMQVLLESDRPEAAEAVELFVYRICRELGSLAAALGGLDALVFTAGIGEHAPEIRRRVCEESKLFGFRLDDAANVADALQISAPDSRTSAWVIPTNEDLVIARHAWDIVKGSR